VDGKAYDVSSIGFSRCFDKMKHEGNLGLDLWNEMSESVRLANIENYLTIEDMVIRFILVRSLQLMQDQKLLLLGLVEDDHLEKDSFHRLSGRHNQGLESLSEAVRSAENAENVKIVGDIILEIEKIICDVRNGKLVIPNMALLTRKERIKLFYDKYVKVIINVNYSRKYFRHVIYFSQSYAFLISDKFDKYRMEELNSYELGFRRKVY
jgi:hypothetical protein